MGEARRLIARGDHGEVAERTLARLKAVVACCDAEDFDGALEALSRALGEFEASHPFARDNQVTLDELMASAVNLRIGAPRRIRPAAKALAERALALRLRLIGQPV